MFQLSQVAFQVLLFHLLIHLYIIKGNIFLLKIYIGIIRELVINLYKLKYRTETKLNLPKTAFTLAISPKYITQR
jgi:hypothetical protein